MTCAPTILHLVGDAHQPLHAVARFTASIPNGDAGGNAESVIPLRVRPLRFTLTGTASSAVIHPPTAPFSTLSTTASPTSPNKIAAEVFRPGSLDQRGRRARGAIRLRTTREHGDERGALTCEYETNARNIAHSQAALAAARLANLINGALKQVPGTWPHRLEKRARAVGSSVGGALRAPRAPVMAITKCRIWSPAVNRFTAPP
jgi:hypothetical protein